MLNDAFSLLEPIGDLLDILSYGSNPIEAWKDRPSRRGGIIALVPPLPVPPVIMRKQQVQAASVAAWPLLKPRKPIPT